MLPFLSVAGLQISTFVLTWVLLFVIATIWLERVFVQMGIEPSRARFLMCVTAFAGVTGAKVYAMIKLVLVEPDTSSAALVNESGFGSYGLILFGLTSAAVAMKFMKLPPLAIMDRAVPMMIFAIAMGRLACFLTGDGCYGPPTDLPWGIAFPYGVNPTSVKVHPTPVYEILAMIPVTILILRLPSTGRRRGSVFLVFLFLTSVVRFLTEFYRSTTYPRIHGMTGEQVIAAILIILSTMSYIHVQQKKKPNHSHLVLRTE
jgi:phosphatidylglycerol:prolipoprotein diacylglycerol transferase